MKLVSKFGQIVSTRSHTPLSNETIMRIAPSIFSLSPHQSRSDRYTCIPTIDILNALRKEGFEPFSICQTRVREEDKLNYTKHMIRLRYAGQISDQETEANEIILLNSHDGSSSYQMLSGMFRFACSNGLVLGETYNDIRIPHKGDVISRVIEGAFTVLDSFERMNAEREAMQAIMLNKTQELSFARAALSLKYEEEEKCPINHEQLLLARRPVDFKCDIWHVFNRIQENLIKGGLRGYDKNGRRMRTRPVIGINQNIRLNRALWALAIELKQLAK